MIWRRLQRLRGLIHTSWFIRIVYAQLEDWEDARGNANNLAGAAFSRIEEKVSVFKVYGAVEEARAIAACQLPRGQTPRKTVVGIRFFSHEVKEAGIRMDKSPGKTGVPSVDLTHWDLVGNEEAYRKLTDTVLARQREGHDRVRRMGKNRMLIQFRVFLKNDSEALSERAREKCQEFVQKLERSGQ